MKKLNDIIQKKIHRFINRILFIEKRNVFNFEGTNLFPSEIHLIMIVSEEPTNATLMAEKLNVTKGAVSQTITRLEKKGILQKIKDPYNKNALTLVFTAKGKKVFTKYKELENSMNMQLEKNIDSFNKNEKEVIDRFLDQLNDLFEKIK